MIVQYSAAALVSENKVLAHPASVDSIPSSAGQEDHVSMGTIAARKAGEIAGNVRRVLAMELMVACQGIDMRGNKGLGKGTQAAYDLVRSKVATLDEDRELYGDINYCEEIIKDGSLIKAVEEAIAVRLKQDNAEPEKGGKYYGRKRKKERPVRLPNIFEAVLPILVMMVLMIYGFVGGGDYTDAHMPLVISIAVACIIGGICGHSFSDMLAGMLDRLNATMEAILILCTVGILVATFIMSGTIPALIYYGLDLLTPSLFLPVGCLMVSIVSLACGSSWTATATIGIAFLGIGAGLGINPALTAGMVISGAYVGDKFSPLSDTTNLAAAVAQTGLFDHVTAMISTTAPTFIISLILYTILGLNIDTSNFDASVATDLQHALAEGFNLNPLVLLPIAVIIVVCILKMPGLVGIAISVGVGILCTMVFQECTVSAICLILYIMASLWSHPMTWPMSC